jgi:small subunit ribosomal protein S16
MVKLRLKRMGAINKPFYRIVAVDSRKKRDGKYLESLGYYDPKTDPLTLKVDIDKCINWLKVGAQPSETVRSLFKQAGIIEKWHNIRMGIKEVDKPEKVKKEKVGTKKEKVIEETAELVAEQYEPVKEEKVKKAAVKTEKIAEEQKEEKKTADKPEDKATEEKEKSAESNEESTEEKTETKSEADKQ